MDLLLGTAPLASSLFSFPSIGFFTFIAGLHSATENLFLIYIPSYSQLSTQHVGLKNDTYGKLKWKFNLHHLSEAVGDLKRILYAGHRMNKKQDYAHCTSYLVAY